MPIRRAIAETLALGSSASITTWALNSYDQRRRSCRGAPSRQSATASIIRRVLVPELGVNIEALIGSQTQQPIADCSTPCARRGLFAAYDLKPDEQNEIEYTIHEIANEDGLVYGYGVEIKEGAPQNILDKLAWLPRRDGLVPIPSCDLIQSSD